MKRDLAKEMISGYSRYIAIIKSYCEVMGIAYQEPSLPQFLRANALTHERLLSAKDNKAAPQSKTTPNISFSDYVKQRSNALVK